MKKDIRVLAEDEFINVVIASTAQWDNYLLLCSDNVVVTMRF